FYGAASILTGVAAYLAGLPLFFFIGLLLVTTHLFYQIVRLRPDSSGERWDSALALKLFKSNRTSGLIWFFSLLAVHFTGFLNTGGV
ncbi:MAG TPA: 4-hydroxybenzoate octaprenyltransferase, partial [Asticcacaulis sp.]|nr:4-hydroxybenzoate octaprenyltransferase [Asticcacaulis sp.]